MKINTTPGETYIVLSTGGCTVTTGAGKQIKKLAAGQDFFTAMTGDSILSDDNASVTVAKGEILSLLNLDGSGSGSGEGLTEEERDLLTGAAQRDEDNTFSAANTFTGTVDMSGAQVTPPSGWNVGELTAAEVQSVVPMAWSAYTVPAEATKESSVALGGRAWAHGANTTALGVNTGCYGPHSTAVGNSTVAQVQYTTAVGAHFYDGSTYIRTTSEAPQTVVVGNGAQILNPTNDDGTPFIGTDGNPVVSSNSVVIGTGAVSKNLDSVVIGAAAKSENGPTSNKTSVVVGTRAYAAGGGANVSIGTEAKATGSDTSIGFKAAGTGGYSVAVGAKANNNAATKTTLLGADTTITNITATDGTIIPSANTTVIGYGTTASAPLALTIGAQFAETTSSGNVTRTCSTEGTGSITIGAGANTLNVTADDGTVTESSNSVTIGCKAMTKKSDSVVIGAAARTDGDNLPSVAIGRSATCAGSGNNVAIGALSVSSGGDTNVGHNARVYGGSCVGIGSNVSNDICTKSIVIGSAAKITNTTAADGTVTKSDNSTVVGYGATASAPNVVVIGASAKGSSASSVAIGVDANSGSSAPTVAIGTKATAGGADVAIGYEAYASYGHSIGLGYRAKTSAGRTVCVGTNATITNTTAADGTVVTYSGNTAVIGYGVSASAPLALTFGSAFSDTEGSYTCTTQGTGSITIGAGANTLNTTATVDGVETTVESSNSVTVGCKAENKGADSVVLGAQARGLSAANVVIGSGAKATSGRSVSVGNAATASYAAVNVGYQSVGSTYSVAVGCNATAYAQKAVIVGTSATVNSTGDTSSDNTTVIGYGASASAPNAVVLGANASTAGDGTIIIGAGTSLAAGTGNIANAILIGRGAKSIGEWASGSIAIGPAATVRGDASYAIGSGSDSATAGMAIGTSAKAGDYSTAFGYQCTNRNNGTLAFRQEKSMGETYTQFYIMAAESALATQYEDGEACMGYVVKNKTTGELVAAGTQKLSVLFPHNSTFQPAMLGLDDEYVAPKVFHPDDLDLPVEEEPTEEPENVETTLPDPEEYTPMPVYSVVESTEEPEDITINIPEPTIPEQEPYTPLPVYPIVEPEDVNTNLPEPEPYTPLPVYPIVEPEIEPVTE